jgi:hypothetical protein
MNKCLIYHLGSYSGPTLADGEERDILMHDFVPASATHSAPEDEASIDRRNQKAAGGDHLASRETEDKIDRPAVSPAGSWQAGDAMDIDQADAAMVVDNLVLESGSHRTPEAEFADGEARDILMVPPSATHSTREDEANIDHPNQIAAGGEHPESHEVADKIDHPAVSQAGSWQAGGAMEIDQAHGATVVDNPIPGSGSHRAPEAELIIDNPRQVIATNAAEVPMGSANQADGTRGPTFAAVVPGHFVRTVRETVQPDNRSPIVQHPSNHPAYIHWFKERVEASEEEIKRWRQEADGLYEHPPLGLSENEHTLQQRIDDHKFGEVHEDIGLFSDAQGRLERHNRFGGALPVDIAYYDRDTNQVLVGRALKMRVASGGHQTVSDLYTLYHFFPRGVPRHPWDLSGMLEILQRYPKIPQRYFDARHRWRDDDVFELWIALTVMHRMLSALEWNHYDRTLQQLKKRSLKEIPRPKLLTNRPVEPPVEVSSSWKCAISTPQWEEFDLMEVVRYFAFQSLRDVPTLGIAVDFAERVYVPTAVGYLLVRAMSPTDAVEPLSPFAEGFCRAFIEPHAYRTWLKKKWLIMSKTSHDFLIQVAPLSKWQTFSGHRIKTATTYPPNVFYEVLYESHAPLEVADMLYYHAVTWLDHALRISQTAKSSHKQKALQQLESKRQKQLAKHGKPPVVPHWDLWYEVPEADWDSLWCATYFMRKDHHHFLRFPVGTRSFGHKLVLQDQSQAVVCAEKWTLDEFPVGYVAQDAAGNWEPVEP